MQPNAITSVFLPIALAVIMLGLGLSLGLSDFRRVIVYPRAVAVGLVAQVIVLPAVCLGIAHLFSLPPELAIGLMLLAASPGGATANLFSHLAKGDVALNITLTAVNSVLSVVTLPLLVGFSISHFLGTEEAIPLQFTKVVSVIAVVLVPVAIGMVVRARQPRLADKLDRPVRALSAVFLLLVVIAAVYQDRANAVTYFKHIGFPALAFNLASLGIGYAAPRLFGVERRQAIAVGMEIGVHNGALAIAVAVNVLGNSVMAIPAAVYSLIMFVTAALFGMLVARHPG